MNSVVKISEDSGVTLTISRDVSRAGALVANLAGSKFNAEVGVDSDPAFPDLGKLHEFFDHSALLQSGAQTIWTALGEDLELKAETLENGLVLIHVYLGSTSDDACNWLVNATLQVSRDELRRCSRELSIMFA